METMTTHEACLALMAAMTDNPDMSPKRNPDDPYDYGDDDTAFCCVKRSNRMFWELDPNKDMGVFLGRRDGNFMVLKRNLKSEIVGGERFSTLEDLKKEWVLD